MGIAEFSTGPSRKRIGFVRSLPPGKAQTLFKLRGYECYLLDDAAPMTPRLFDTTDSVVISQHPDKPSHFKRDLEYFSEILNYDCRIYVRYAVELRWQAFVLDALAQLRLPPSGFDKAEVRRFTNDWFDPKIPLFAPFVHILRADDDWGLLANLISNNPAGRPPNINVEIDPRTAGDVGPALLREREQLRLTTERELLLRRAFFECSAIELFPKTDGMSGVDAFEAFAHSATNVVGGPAPYRCFVKLGPRVKVAREFEKYRTTALENVPYHLGPRLRADRCVLGKSQGLITCDYVAGAETLRDSVRGGRAVHVIGNLFNQTLIAWRRAATPESRPLQEFLADHLSERTGIPDHREPLVRGYGATQTLAELKGLLAQAPPSKPVLVGVIHGDLHATNVLVRMNDAVIIDLERIASGQPLLLDAASLEGGLFVDGFVGDRRSADEVLESVRRLYTASALEEDDHYCNPANRSAWFFDSVRQIRMQARQMELQTQQYGWTLAAVLLKKACNQEDLRVQGESEGTVPRRLSREDVRAMAFVLAENIILGLSAHRGTRQDEGL